MKILRLEADANRILGCYQRTAHRYFKFSASQSLGTALQLRPYQTGQPNFGALGL
jgi:hypothetical protein